MESDTYKILLKSNIFDFIVENDEADTGKLALKKPPVQDWPMQLILDQIKARQKAKIKIPEWFDRHLQLIFPNPNLVEQASSLATAIYKAGLSNHNGSFLDLTAGMGVDSYVFSQKFKSGTAIEKDTESAEILAHNFEQLGCQNIKTLNIAAESFITDMPEFDMIYLDPARRTKTSKGKYQLEDCSPNIFELLPVLRKKSKEIIIKTSPMLDIDHTLNTLPGIHSVHILEFQGECKEILYVISNKEQISDLQIIKRIAASLSEDGKIQHKIETTKKDNESANTLYSAPLQYLYEPSAAFQKLGLFTPFFKKWPVKKLAPNTHLFTSDEPIKDFPGRAFVIQNIYPVQRSALPIKKANLTIRNFPMSTAELQKKLKIQNGGDDYLFACEIIDFEKQYALIHTKKL